MTPPIPFWKPNIFISLAFSLLAFGVGFGISYQQDFIGAGEIGRLAWLHLVYAEELKDDMEIIDWSKNLQNFDGILAFQAVDDKKVVAEGGNRNFLPVLKVPGVSYSFPTKWIYHMEKSSAEKRVKELTLVYRVWPGPLLWGFTLLILCFITGLGATELAALFLPGKISQPLPTLAVPKPKLIFPAVLPQNPSISQSEKPFLFLDRNYVIQQVTPEAARLLQRNAADLMNGHLFDLDPEPELMQAIEKAEETKLSKPFLSHPKLSAFLKPDPNGTLLFLESSEQPETA